MSTEQAPDVTMMAQLLLQLTQPDTVVIRQAEAALKPHLKQAACMQTLWQIVMTTHASEAQDEVAVRHVAAIVLRKRLPGHYTHMDDALKLQWQNEILQALARENVRPVRTSMVALVASLAQVDQRATQPVLQFLSAAVQHESPAAREMCFALLAEMTETVCLHWKDHLPDLVQLFQGILQDPNQPAVVHKAAIRALGQYLIYWADEPEMDHVAHLLPIMLQVAQQASGIFATHSHSTLDEDFISVVLDVLYELAYSPATGLQSSMVPTVEFALACLVDANLELRVRDAAALVIATTAESKPKTLGRQTALLEKILDALFRLMEEASADESAAGALFESNPAWRQDLLDDAAEGGGDMDHEHDFDSPTQTSMAQGTLDVLACEIPKKFIWNLCHTRVTQRILLHHNPTPAQRKAGVAGLGVIAEGCSDPLTAALHELLPAVLLLARDETAQVRECACFCLGQISEHCQPEILQYSQSLLPVIFGLLDDGSVAVQATSCYVLEMFCERLEPDAVRPLLDSLVRKLAHMLEVSQKRSVQEMAVAALAATAVAAEAEFAPYMHGVASLMTRLMELQDPHLFSLRGRALECMGHMAIAVGRETFQPYFVPTMQCAMQGLSFSSSSSTQSSEHGTDLQEFAYAVFANLAKVMKDAFAPALPDLVPHLISVIEQDEGQVQPASEAAASSSSQDGTTTLPIGGGGDTTSAAEKAFAGLDDSDNEDDDDDNAQYVVTVRTALLEVKKGAITALGEMAAHTGTHFCPHLEASMQVLQKAAGNWHPLIKCEVADAFPSMIVPSIAAYHNGTIAWTKGGLPPEDGSPAEEANTTLSAHTAALVQAVLTEEIALMRDEEKSVVGKACEAVQSVVELCGPAALSPVSNECLEATHALLTREAPCQTAEAMFGEVPEEGGGFDDDHDVVMQAVCDLVGGLARVMGPHLVPYLQTFLPAICEYSKASRPSTDRSMAVGCLSELAQEMPAETVLQYWQSTFLPALLQGLADEDVHVQRNAAFLAGMCCEKGGSHIVSDYPNVLQHLGRLFEQHGPSHPNSGSGEDAAVGQEAAAACLDNAAAAVSRMIMASTNHVPLSAVLPALLAALPLQTDMTENETVYTCLLGLLQGQQPDLLAHAAAVQRIFQQACAEDSAVDDEIKAQLRAALQQQVLQQHSRAQ